MGAITSSAKASVAANSGVKAGPELGAALVADEEDSPSVGAGRAVAAAG
jgi:hypothetical protein